MSVSRAKHNYSYGGIRLEHVEESIVVEITSLNAINVISPEDLSSAIRDYLGSF